MYTITITKKATGVALYGKIDDLLHLHEVVHHLSDAADPEDNNTKGMNLLMMNFAYEIRKACGGSRLTGAADDKTLNGKVGFQLVWPDIFLYTNALRQAAGKSINDEALLLQLDELENVLKIAIEKFDKKAAEGLTPYIGKRICTDDPYIFQLYQSIHVEFIIMGAGKTRLRELPKLIDDYFQLNSVHRRLLIRKWEAEARESNCHPSDLEFVEFPTIIW